MSAFITKPLLRVFLALFVLVGMFMAGASPGYANGLRQDNPEPTIGAKAAIVVEYPSGRVLFEKSMHERVAPASTTKILTSILALEHGNLDEEVTITADDMVGESTMGLENGEKQTMHNLLYGMLLPSGNDAAMAVARHLGSAVNTAESAGKDPITRFVGLMNSRATQLGLADSHFVNPHGLDADGHYSSAYDLASLTWYAFQFPVFNEIVKTPFYDAPGHSLRNTNEMLTRYAGADGVKTGWTDAGGLCLVTSATRDGHRLISVVLNAPHWYTDSGAILDYGFAKLAATPQDATAEVLSVAKRGTVAWVMANATSTPPIPTPAVAMAQGGGAAPAGKVGSASNAPAPASGQNAAQNAPAASHLALVASGGGSSFPTGLLLGLLMLAAGGGAIFWFFSRRPADFSLAAVVPALQAVMKSRAVLADDIEFDAPPVAAPRPAARTLGESPALRRREPNLLLSHQEMASQRIASAVDLAAQGRQGSSMAEFLLALRSGILLDVVAIDSAYGLNPAGFLALSRAQAAAGQTQAARQTLEHGMQAFPSERMISLALHQLH